MSVLLFKKSEGVATLRLNRPEKYNSITEELAKALHQALDDCQNDEDVRVILITGEGKAFCAGQDLKEAVDDNGLSIPHIVEHHFNPLIKRIANIEKPVVAAVNGVAAGAGANIAIASDICIAKASASFIQAFSMIGLIPDSGGTFFLPRIIGHQKASALMMLGDKVSAGEAAEMGMIYKVVEDEDFDNAIIKLCAKLALMPTKGLALTKKALLLGRSNSLEEQLDLELKLQTEAGNTHDYREGTTAFLEKRKPNFLGK